MAIYISSDIQFNSINLEQFSNEKDSEICALKLQTVWNSFIVICIYRAPSGKFTYFLNQLEIILNKLYNSSNSLIICGDFNINFLDGNSKIHLLDSLLASFNLSSTVKFPTRIFNNSHILIDNIYIDTHVHQFSVSSLINGLSDHDAQVITLSNISCSTNKKQYSYFRTVNTSSLREFTNLLSYENWEDVFQNTNDDANIIFNNFLNMYLRIFHASFPIKKKRKPINRNPGLLPELESPVLTNRNSLQSTEAVRILNLKCTTKNIVRSCLQLL